MARRRYSESEDCNCKSAKKLEAYRHFIECLADLAGAVTAVSPEGDITGLRPLEKFDVVEQARKILQRYGDYDGDLTH